MNKIFAAVIAAVIILPQAGYAAYSSFPGQTIKIEKINASAPPVDLDLAELLTVSPATLTISIFGKNYTVDIANASILRADRSASSVQELFPGNRINIFGRLDETNLSLIHAEVVRNPFAPGTNPPPTTPPPTTPPPGGDDGEGDVGGGDLSALVRALHTHVSTGVDQDSLPVVQRERWKRADLSTWNTFGGSQNIAPIAEAAAGDYKFFEELAELESEQGLMSKEIGSPGFYFSMPFVSKMAALRDARQAGDTAAANKIADNLKASLTFWSLVAVPGGRSASSGNFAGQAFSAPGNSNMFTGVMVAAAGERFNAHLPPSSLMGDDMSVLLAWALDMPRSAAALQGKNLLQQGEWWHSIVAELTGVGNYTATTPPEAWGLTEDDREALRGIVEGDTSDLDDALDTLREYGVWDSYIFRLRRTTEGVETVFFRSANGNKPAHAATSITDDGAYKTMRPCFGNSSGANRGFTVWIEDGTIYANGDQARCRLVSQPELGGNVIYSVAIEGDSISRGNVTNPDPVPPGPGDTSPGTDTSLRVVKDISVVRGLAPATYGALSGNKCAALFPGKDMREMGYDGTERVIWCLQYENVSYTSGQEEAVVLLDAQMLFPKRACSTLGSGWEQVPGTEARTIGYCQKPVEISYSDSDGGRQETAFMFAVPLEKSDNPLKKIKDKITDLLGDFLDSFDALEDVIPEHSLINRHLDGISILLKPLDHLVGGDEGAGMEDIYHHEKADVLFLEARPMYPFSASGSGGTTPPPTTPPGGGGGGGGGGGPDGPLVDNAADEEDPFGGIFGF